MSRGERDRWDRRENPAKDGDNEKLVNGMVSGKENSVAKHTNQFRCARLLYMLGSTHVGVIFR